MTTMSIHVLASHFNSAVSIRAFDSGTVAPAQSYEQASAFVGALTQSDASTAIIDTRCIHDTNRATAAISRRGTLWELWGELCAWNTAGFGVFVCVNDMDGNGREIANVQTIRCQAVDLDSLSAQQNYERATEFNPPPSFAVQSSPGRWHVYWQTQQHKDRDKFTLLQRKLAQHFDGDKKIIDPSRVLRLPGFYHLKSNPHLVTWWALSGYGKPIDTAYIELATSAINVIDGTGERYPLGEPKMQAPGFDWCLRALAETDPNTLERDEWISFTAAWKQAAWNLAPEEQLYSTWTRWCAQYVVDGQGAPSEAYLRKNWNSVRTTQVGWSSLEHRNGNLLALRLFGEKKAEVERNSNPPPMPHEQAPQQMPVPTGEILTAQEQQEWFKGCTYIESRGEILTADGRFMNASKFNGAFGGKKFIIDSVGKMTDEPWKAATRSTQWTVPKVDHLRFLPSQQPGTIVTDALGRRGVNTYKPAMIETRQGDVAPFMNHIAAMFPSEHDRKILFDYLAHNIKFPGYKIPWAPLLQSTEGAGKNVIKLLMNYAMGEVYTYEPKAKELVDSGSKFNAWMRDKLFIVVDEIKTDDRRDLVETLKPMISEEQIELQAKGIDQVREDNFANWMFYSNYKDAIPINKNGRRFAVFYSAIQTVDDLALRGMNDVYFRWLYDWLRSGGLQQVAHWFMNYPIERSAIPMRAPDTSSTAEALREGLSETAKIIVEMIEDQKPGFLNGWASAVAVEHHWPKYRPNKAPPPPKATSDAIRELGFVSIGKASRPYFQDDPERRARLWFRGNRNVTVDDYPNDQCYLTR